MLEGADAGGGEGGVAVDDLFDHGSLAGVGDEEKDLPRGVDEREGHREALGWGLGADDGENGVGLLVEGR